AVIAFLRILTSAIRILGDNRFLFSAAREAAPYTNIRHAILRIEHASIESGVFFDAVVSLPLFPYVV
ncbi:hypothetical protein, partial [Slackia isoflavoniconvertens]|uniref:hypothetical protein n=1 Tax=Slackia isoflavoniconvertens TaxID=572010 RepID=UPI003AB3FCBB